MTCNEEKPKMMLLAVITQIFGFLFDFLAVPCQVDDGLLNPTAIDASLWPRNRQETAKCFRPFLENYLFDEIITMDHITEEDH